MFWLVRKVLSCLIGNNLLCWAVCFRFFALKYAADAACTVLRVDQVIYLIFTNKFLSFGVPKLGMHFFYKSPVASFEAKVEKC